jgi:branched-chain amino acid transport system permease protein
MSSTLRYALYAALAVVLLLLPMFVESQYFLRVIVLCGFYVMLAVSLNITVGYTGLLTIGHAAFFGIGAYVTALLMMDAGWNFWLALAAGSAAAGICGLLLGFPSLRLRGDYLAIATIAFSETLRLVALNWNDVTRGPMGVPGIPKPAIGSLVISSQFHYYYLVLALVLLTTYTAVIIKSSMF